ncbi:nucleoside-diphosphate-sugar epimerase/pimeloyl-ACP methyl ester carboxylesterase [Streptosporangium becharense]|uniref:Nucleoside-diphosphate-sugar epimerase/pimeloyl-ACP methyl ester carboxylesterase n=1 Tax=Streptosporangium becharense TaxID=1816182 RepID=A0A7W9IBL3_9ACTN|nr:alpha/beta fold hydrolase [Streptosporangium becharense]MBB2914224.1 nucleoside-diphosphate-sugar epimerase/pimeloyl-ACP methyl ester carboxylesterase [Streptosporangium becharense]MBB5817251.1 nucleoside-diphosphate-sugar epimerase/pimeloyl-ACP methyl ester carboxylesterase [Streptosporangium becharense]
MIEEPQTLVAGATGLIGRWLTAELLTRGRPVAVTVRGGPARGADLRAWLRGHGVDDQALTVVPADITRPGLGLTPGEEDRLRSVRDVFNAAALFRFGLGRDEARRANVDGAVNVVRWAGARPRLRRLVHISGYRVGAETLPYPAPEDRLAEVYRRHGAYEGSKREGDAAVRTVAAREGIPLTVVNPATVIGHSVTGEAGQYLGLADMVRRLWTGRLPVLAGTRRTFVPVVTVDHLARFLAAVPEHDHEPYRAHWVLDDATPHLPDLVTLLARHLGVRAPRAVVPVGLVRRLPRALTGVDPETLTFLSEDRYDTSSADALADAAGLSHPPVDDALRRWADRLVAERFGDTRPPLSGGFHPVAGAPAYLAGDRLSPGYVLLHGLPLTAETWQGVLGELDGTALVADLPGLGRSARSTAGPADWLAGLLTPLRTRPVLIAHSAATAPALRYAHAHPGRLAALVLVSPYFLQRRPRRHLRTPALVGPLLRTAPARRLGTALLGPGVTDVAALRAVDDAVAQLRRPGVARRTARWLHRAQHPAERAELRALTATCPVPVHLVTGERAPLINGIPGVPVTVVPGAGHHPQLTHPAHVAAAARTGVRTG